jgi:hypothetical protein
VAVLQEQPRIACKRQRLSDSLSARDEHEPVAMKANLLAVPTRSSLRPGMEAVAFPIDIRIPQRIHQQPGGQTFSEFREAAPTGAIIPF